MTEIQRISIELFDPNPYQPETRIQVTDQVAEQYGKSILQHGLLQTPLARVSPKSKVHGKEPGYRYEMGDGWLRLTGFRWLVKNGHPDFKTIPCEIRDLSDEQMAHLVFEANGVRKDLNPIETATYFEKYITDFKVTEGKLAEIHGLSQGEVANTMRLLQLPKEVQYLVAQGTLPQTHARHLIRLNKVPEMQAKMVKEVVKDQIPVSRLSNDIEVNLWQHSKSLNNKSEESYNRPTFDVDKECKGCEHTVEASYPYGNRKKELRCLQPECWDKKEAAAVAVKIKEAKEELSKTHKGAKIFTNKDLNYNQREDLSDFTLKQLDNPGECKKCDKVVLYKYDLKSPGAPEKVCTNPQCMRTKKGKKTRDENKIKSVEDKELTKKLGEIFQHVPSPRAAILVMARHFLPSLSAAAKVDLAQIIPGLPKLANGHLDPDALMVKVEGLGIDELIRLVVAARICESRRHSYEKFSTVLSPELDLDMATIDGNYDKYILKVKKWQEENCRGCSNAKEMKVGTGLDCCEYSYNRKILSDGTCERGKAHKAKLAEKRASVVDKEAPSGEEPKDKTPHVERDRKEVLAEQRALAGVPEGIRLVEEVPDAECKGCGLTTEDHTIDMKFKLSGVVPANNSICNGNDTYIKVCVKDWRKMKPATQEAIVEVGLKAAEQLREHHFVGIQVLSDAEGIKTLHCTQAILDAMYDINSAGTLIEKKPRLAGLYELGEEKYAVIGAVLTGKDGVESCDLILALPFQETDKIPPGTSHYQGKKCSCRGKEYILAGRFIEARRQTAPGDKSAGKITKKVTTECTADSCPINIDEIGKKVKKIKEPKAQASIQCPTADLEQGSKNNETETKTVSSPSPAQPARSPTAEAKTSELAELKPNVKQAGKSKKSAKKIRAGASPLK